jgi:hypothetical protein
VKLGCLMLNRVSLRGRLTAPGNLRVRAVRCKPE